MERPPKNSGHGGRTVILTGGLFWRMALLIFIPLIIWAVTEGRYRLVSERAGGIHFITKVDRFDADNACLILRAENRVPALKPYTCVE